MTNINGIPCVSYAELTSSYDGPCLINANRLSSLVKSGRVYRAQRGGGRNKEAMVVFSTLPDEVRTEYIRRYGDPFQSTVPSPLTENIEARAYYAAYTYSLGDGMREVHLTEDMVRRLTANATVLSELVRLIGSRIGGVRAERGLWKRALSKSESLRTATGHSLPSSLNRLRQTVVNYRAAGYACLVPRSVGNVNRLKITAEASRLIIALKRSRTPIYTEAQLFTAYNTIAPSRGLQTLKTVSTLHKFLHSPAVLPLWYDADHGELAASQKFARRHRTSLPTMRDALWYGDGTKLNLYYRDNDGHVRTTQVYEVIDAYSEVLLGYHISDSEDYRAQFLALRMALQTSGHRPYEFVYDNQGGHKKLSGQGLFDRIVSHVHRATAPYSGQSKTIENIFCRFQQQVLHQHWAFTGQNVTTKSDKSKPNLELIEANKDKLPTYPELQILYANMRAQWNTMAHPATGISRMEMYKSSTNPETLPVTVEDMVDIFWASTSRPVTFTASGITLTMGHVRKPYEVYSAPGVPDHAWRRLHTGQRFIIRYDPYDLSAIRLYSIEPDGSQRFAAIAKPYMVVPRALQDQQKGDASFIRQEQAANFADRAERQLMARAMALSEGTDPEQHGLRVPDLKGNVPAALQEDIDRRTAVYSRPQEPLATGRVTKIISNTTYDQLPEASVVAACSDVVPETKSNPKGKAKNAKVPVLEVAQPSPVQVPNIYQLIASQL
jgi:hypothetical protein